MGQGQGKEISLSDDGMLMNSFPDNQSPQAREAITLHASRSRALLFCR